MSKRFIDTEIWNKDWFMSLTPVEKCAVVYIKCNCNHIGVWKPNIKLAEFMIGASVDWDKLLTHTNGNVEVLDSGKWFISDFCKFQYGVLTSTSAPHRKYISMLKEAGLSERVSKGYAKPTARLKEEDKEKEKEKDNIRGLVNYAFQKFTNATNKRISLSNDRRRILEGCLRKHKPTEKEIDTAVNNFIKDEWPDRHRFSDIIYCFGTRNKIDNFEKWLNVEPATKERGRIDG